MSVIQHLAESGSPDLLPTNFLSADEALASKQLKILKRIYDFTKGSEKKLLLTKRAKSDFTEDKPLQSLIIEGFDEEQIWEEIQLQNRRLYEDLVSCVSKLIAHGNTKKKEAKKAKKKNDLPEPSFHQNQKISQVSKTKKRFPKSSVDDSFFNLSQMNEYMEKIEGGKEPTEDDSSSDEVDLFDNPSDYEDVDSDKGAEDEGYYYMDFFDPPISDVGNELMISSIQDSANENSVEEHQSDAETIEYDDSKNDKNDHGTEKLVTKLEKPSVLSSFEKNVLHADEAIDGIEAQALQPKPWHMLGEIKAHDRPENALLEEHLDYDHLIRQAPEITEQTTFKLEEIIRRRIIDQAWDDVERKIKPVENPSEYKKRLILDAEKSKQSLSQIYEQEYINKMSSEVQSDEKEPEAHVLIRQDMDKLFAKLDALSNYHFTPEAPSSKVKIVSNIPSIMMEEGAPVSHTDKTALAPQEIEEPVASELKNQKERSDTDRKRERRKKKHGQKVKRLAREERARAKGLNLKNIKIANSIITKSKASKDNLDVINAKISKSSSAFFSKLQEINSQKIGNAKGPSKKLSEKKPKSAKSYKL